MNPEFPQNEREQLEAKLTAFLLGELPPDEVVALCKAMDSDPELGALYEKLKLTIGFVRESAAKPSVEAGPQAVLKLSEAKREKLLAQFKTIAPKEFAKPRRGLERVVLVAGVAAAVVIMASLLLPSLAKSKSRSMSKKNSIINNLRLLDGAEQQWALENSKSGDAKPTMGELGTYTGRGGGEMPSIAGEKYVPGKVSEPPKIEMNVADAKGVFGPQVVAGGVESNGKVILSLDDVQGPITTRFQRAVLTPTRSAIAPAPATPPVSTTAPMSTGRIVLPAENQVADVTKEPAIQGTNNEEKNVLAFNTDSFNPQVSRVRQATEGWTVETHDKVGAIGLSDESVARLSAAGSSNDSYNAHTHYSTLGPLGSGNSQENSINLNFTNINTIAGNFDETFNPQQTLYADENVGNQAGGVIAGPVVTTKSMSFANADAVKENRSWGTDSSVPTQRAEQKSEIVLPDTPGFGGGGGAGSVSTLKPSVAIEKTPDQPAADVGGRFSPTTGEPIAPTSPSRDALETRTVKVDPNQFYATLQKAEGNGGSVPKAQIPAGAISTNGSVRGLRYVTGLDPTAEIQTAVTAFFRSNGVDLDVRKGESVFFNDRQGTVTIRGTTEDLDIAQAAIDKLESVQNDAAYLTAKQDLENEKRWRQILAMRTGAEAVDKDLPRARMVTIVDAASTNQQGATNLWGKIRQAFTGKVESTARISVDQEHPDISGLGTGPAGTSYDPYFLLTEFETIQSDAVLSKVIDAMNLQEKWGQKYNDGKPMSKADVEARIKRELELKPVKNTRSIDISAYSDDPQEAAKLANQIAVSYKQYRDEEYEELKNHGIKSLQDQIAEQDKKVTLAEAKVIELAQQYGISGDSSVRQPDRALPKPAVPPPTPQPEILTRENAFSTFSLNVSDVSFKLAAASLEKGQMPEPASIRSEEFINAFDYRDPEAPAGVPIAFASERARYPFAHNRELLRFSLKTAAAGRQAGRPLNIVLLLDNSGSMERADRVRIIQEALRVLAGQLNAHDTFSIVTFARTAQLRVDGVSGDKAGAAAAKVAGLTPEGGTNLGDALDLAYEIALKHYLANGDNRVVLLTDGAANLGDVNPDALKQKVEAHRKQGVALDCFGIGWEDYNDDLLEVLTRNGDGRYGFINSPEEASTTFVSQIAGALHVAAQDVKVQVEFNPKRVISYRQIGYAKHQLTKEQFRDNTVDAAEIAAQEAGNALYTIEINPQGEGSVATVRVRYKVPGTSEYREQAWDVPYTGGAVALDQASPAMRLAATASAFSEWLATSPFADEVSTDALLKYLNGVPQVYGADKRPAKLEWMIRQAKSISGK